MKKLNVLPMALFAIFALVSCKKTEKVETIETTETPTEVVVQEENTTNDAEVKSVLDGMKVISTQQYTGDGIAVEAIYMGDEEGNMGVRLGLEELVLDLPQKEAWAKGAIYETDDAKFTNKGQINEAELVFRGKTHKLKLVK